MNTAIPPVGMTGGIAICGDGDDATAKVHLNLDLAVQTMLAKHKKGNLATLTNEQASVDTPKAGRGTVSNNTIPQSSDESNSPQNNVYWTNLDDRKKQFAEEYNLWEICRKKL